MDIFSNGEKTPAVFHGRMRQLLTIDTHMRRGDSADVRQVAGLVTPFLHGGLLKVARQQIRRICFQHDPADWNMFDRLLQILSTALVANPAGDADMHAHRHVLERLVHGAGKTMGHRAGKVAAIFGQHADEIIVGIALMQEYRHTKLACELQLNREGFALLFRC